MSTLSDSRRDVLHETPITTTRLPIVRSAFTTWMKSESPETSTYVPMLGYEWAISMQSAVILTSTLFLIRPVRIPLALVALGEGALVGTKTGSIPAAYREGGSFRN